MARPFLFGSFASLATGAPFNSLAFAIQEVGLRSDSVLLLHEHRRVLVARLLSLPVLVLLSDPPVALAATPASVLVPADVVADVTLNAGPHVISPKAHPSNTESGPHMFSEVRYCPSAVPF